MTGNDDEDAQVDDDIDEQYLSVWAWFFWFGFFFLKIKSWGKMINFNKNNYKVIFITSV